MKHNFKCEFCDSPSERYEDIYICKACETVCFFTDCPLDEKHRKVKTYLGEIQSQILEQQEYLHQIEQKRILQVTLSNLEEEICEKMSEFHSICMELEKLIKDGSKLCTKSDRQLLYRLLMMSKWLSGGREDDNKNAI